MGNDDNNEQKKKHPHMFHLLTTQEVELVQDLKKQEVPLDLNIMEDLALSIIKVDGKEEVEQE